MYSRFHPGVKGNAPPRDLRGVGLLVIAFFVFLAQWPSEGLSQETLPTVEIGAVHPVAPERGPAPEPAGQPPTQAEQVGAGDEVLLRSPTHAQESSEAPADEVPSISSSVPALGNVKKALRDRGFDVRLNYTGEFFGNPRGGVKRETIYEGLFEMVLNNDLEKIIGWPGATIHINAYQIHGRGLTDCCISSFSPISSIEARHSTRLFDVWFEQRLFDNKASVKIGRLALDSEFAISDFSTLFVNSIFGWPNSHAINLPGGGPVYPIASPGVRIKVAPLENIVFLAAVTDGDPSGAGFSGLEETRDPNGLRFRLKDPPLLIGETQIKYKLGEPSLNGTVKIGAWRHFGKFDDQRFGQDGLSLSDPMSIGVPLTHRGDFGVYGIIDQRLWQPADDPTKGVAAFTRLAASPSDRNALNFYADAGVNLFGVLGERPDDVFGVAAAISKVSPSIRDFDRDVAFFTGVAAPVRDYEIVVELTYQAQIVPGLIVQPDMQLIIHPQGGANPRRPEWGRIRDAAIFGLRTVIKF
jgi:porin